MFVLQKITLLLLVLALATCARAGEVEDSFARGYAAYTQGNYKMALFAYRAALSWPGAHTARAHYNVGVCHFQLRQLPEAIKAYRAAVQANPRYFVAAYGLGLALAEQGDNDGARQAFSNAVEWSEGRQPDALLELGTHLTLAGDYLAGETRLRQALHFAGPHQPAAHNNLGVTLARQGRYQEAEKEFLAAHQLAPQRWPLALANLKLCRLLLRSQAPSLARWSLAGNNAPGPT